MISWISVSNWIILSFEKGTAEKSEKKKKRKKRSSTCSHTYTSSHTLACKHKLTVLLRVGFLQFETLTLVHQPVNQSRHHMQGVSRKCLSTFLVDQQWSILVRGRGTRARVSAHHRHKPTQLWLRQRPRQQHSGKIGFRPMAIRRTVKADSSLLTKA